jgi:hypothetical protein
MKDRIHTLFLNFLGYCSLVGLCGVYALKTNHVEKSMKQMRASDGKYPTIKLNNSIVQLWDLESPRQVCWATPMLELQLNELSAPLIFSHSYIVISLLVSIA